MEYSNNRRLFPSVSKENDQHCRGEQCTCQSSFSLMKNLNPVSQTTSTLIFAKLRWSVDDQLSSLWLVKACPCPDQRRTGFSTLGFSQLHLMVVLFSKEASNGVAVLQRSSYWDNSRGKPTDQLL